MTMVAMTQLMNTRLDRINQTWGRIKGKFKQSAVNEITTAISRIRENLDANPSIALKLVGEEAQRFACMSDNAEESAYPSEVFDILGDYNQLTNYLRQYLLRGKKEKEVFSFP